MPSSASKPWLWPVSARLSQGGRLCLILGFILGMAAGAKGQEPLNGAEQRMLDALIDKFEPLPSVGRIWTGAFVAAAGKTEDLRSRIDSVERSGWPEDQVIVKVGALRTELRTIREDRNTFIAGFLSPLQQLALDSILNPPAPSIQHFGFHDRLKCLVCKKPGEGAIFPSGPKSPSQLILPKE